MEKNNINESQNPGVNQEEIMNRVNQTFDKLSQDIKDMITQNDPESNNQFS